MPVMELETVQPFAQGLMEIGGGFTTTQKGKVGKDNG